MNLNIFHYLGFLSIVSLSFAQTTTPWWSSLPACAVTCAQTAAANAGCALNDLQCLCNSPTFFTQFQNCLQSSCPAVSNVNSATTLFSNDCLAIDWTWGESPCIRNCAARAATSVGCALNDRICLCINKVAFLGAFYACITNNCPAQFEDAQNFIATDFICPIVDPPGPTHT